MNRRQILAAVPALAIAPAAHAAPQGPDPERGRMIAVIEQLEACQGWEASNVIAAKAYAAWQMRRAMGLDLPAPGAAQMHIDYQHQSFASYRRTYSFERDRAEGKLQGIPPHEEALA